MNDRPTKNETLGDINKSVSIEDLREVMNRNNDRMDRLLNKKFPYEKENRASNIFARLHLRNKRITERIEYLSTPDDFVVNKLKDKIVNKL